MYADDLVILAPSVASLSTPHLPTVPPKNRPAFGGTVPLFFQMSRVPLNHGNVPLFVRSRIFFPAQFVALPWCPDVNANHPIERNYGNSVRFLAKINCIVSMTE